MEPHDTVEKATPPPHHPTHQKSRHSTGWLATKESANWTPMASSVPLPCAMEPPKVGAASIKSKSSINSFTAFYKRARRCFSLFLILAIWVLGSILWALCVLYLAVFFVRKVLLRKDDSSTLAIVLCTIIALYTGFNAVAKRREWMSMRNFGRRMCKQFHYFDSNTCVFEEFLEDSLDSSLDDRRNGEPFVKANERAIFSFHPHGILSCGWIMNGSFHMRFRHSQVRWLVAKTLFYVPIVRDFCFWIGFGGVNKTNFVRLLRNDRNVALYPGGFEEATLYERNKHRIFLKNRKGFIKLALQFGYKVHAVYTFGEEQTYTSFNLMMRWRLLLNKLKLPGTLPIGEWWCFFMPRQDINLVTVIGKPLQMPRIDQPTQAQVEEYHAKYTEMLVDLFERNKVKYAADPKATLEIY